MHIRQTGKLVTMVFFSIAIFGLVLSPQLALAEISVDSYCQLSIRSMQREVSNFQELIALANQYKNDPETFAQQEEIKRAEFDQAKEALYSSFSTTAEEYVMYMGKNGQEVNKYLDTNPDIKQQIDTLSAQVNSLLEEYESLKGSGEPPELPLP